MKMAPHATHKIRHICSTVLSNTLLKDARWQQSAQSPQGLLKYWARISTFTNLNRTTTMKEAIQLRREHLTLLQTAGSLQGSRLRHSYSEFWNKKCAPGTQWSTWRHYTGVLKFQQTYLSTSRMESQPWDYCGTQPQISFK